MESPAIILNSAPSGAVAVKRLAVVPSTKKLYTADGAVWAEIVAKAYALQGRAVVATAPTDGQVLTWINANNDWEPITPTGGGTITRISEVITSASQSNVTFSSISASYRDLIVVVRGRGDTAATSITVLVQVNADTGSNYDYIVENRFGTASGNAATSMRLGDLSAATAPANYSTGFRINIYDYKGTTFFKQFDSYDGVLAVQNTANMYTDHNAGWWRSTAAITSVKIFLSAGNFVNGSVVSLYGSV